MEYLSKTNPDQIVKKIPLVSKEDTTNNEKSCLVMSNFIYYQKPNDSTIQVIKTLVNNSSTPKLYQDDVWNTWTQKSNDIPFKSTVKEIGDGEDKLAAEYNTKPLGQNSSYDLHILPDEKWEIKKLDSDNSFRLGVQVSAAYTSIIGNVITIFKKVLNIQSDLLDLESNSQIKLCISKIKNNTTRCKTPLLDGLKKHEVAQSNLIKANDIIETLKNMIIKEKKKISLYSSFDGKKYEYSILDAFKKLSIEPISKQEKIHTFGSKDMYNRLYLTNTILNDISIFENISLCQTLNNIVRNIFKDIKLVIVHEKYGYKPISKLDKIICNRITGGRPRCKIL